jgi:ATP synthase protein I
MNEEKSQHKQGYVRAVERQVQRTQRDRHLGFRQSVTTFGTIGWIVALPAVGGAFLGRWLDGLTDRTPFSWTLCLILLGLALGCASAWQYVKRVLRQ